MRKYLIALLVSAAIIGAFFGFLEVMIWRMQLHIAHGDDIPWWELILFSAAKFWGVFWPMLSYFIVTTSLAVAGLLHFLQFVRASSKKAGSS
jgi:hypothetical protein